MFGVFLVLINWTFIGLIIEVFGILNLFGYAASGIRTAAPQSLFELAQQLRTGYHQLCSSDANHRTYPASAWHLQGVFVMSGLS